MNIIADTHTHSLACDHAYSTITENARAAYQKGIKVLCTTEHTPSMLGAPTSFYFGNLKDIPREVEGVYIIKGAEINIVDYDGGFDLEDSTIDSLEWAIASYHSPCIAPKNEAEHTRGWLNIAKNPLIDVIGHCGDERFKADYETIIKAFAEYEKVVEINAHSFEVRPNSNVNCPEIANLCKKYNVKVVVSSDAHFSTNIGKHDKSINLLEEIDFPKENILNADYDRFAEYVNKINKKIILPL